ncbi:MAG: NnrU family protein [Kordiimonadaceae bacterium]|nr:NnrU family protein [Kordiimonadaceae bacterium]
MMGLILGLMLFSVLHLIPFFAPNIRAATIEKFGPNPYKGLFALATIGSFYLLVMGWQAAELIEVYAPPAWARHATPLFALVGIILFIASNAPTNIRRTLRHPQLVGVSIWAIGHLLSNGESRSLVLFGGMFAYCMVAIWGSNKRDGNWVKPAIVPRSRDIITLVIGVAATAAAFYFHESFTGMPVMP